MLTHRLSQYIDQIFNKLPIPGAQIWDETHYFFTECQTTDAFQDENISLEISEWQQYKCMWIENNNITVVIINIPKQPILTWVLDDIYIYDINDGELIKFNAEIHPDWQFIADLWKAEH